MAKDIRHDEYGVRRAREPYKTTCVILANRMIQSHVIAHHVNRMMAITHLIGCYLLGDRYVSHRMYIVVVRCVFSLLYSLVMHIDKLYCKLHLLFPYCELRVI